MLLEIRCNYEKKPSKEYVTLTNVTTWETTKVKNPNESWSATLTIEVDDNTKADEIISKVINYMVEKKEAIKSTVRVHKLSKIAVIKL